MTGRRARTQSDQSHPGNKRPRQSRGFDAELFDPEVEEDGVAIYMHENDRERRATLYRGEVRSGEAS
jgi:hypothetical protein